MSVYHLIGLLKYNYFYTIHHYNIIQLDCRQGFVVYVVSLTDGLLSQVPALQSLEGYLKQYVRLSQLHLCSLCTIHSYS